MTDEEINAAIAEACGWTRVNATHSSGKAPNADYVGEEFIPNYCNDLNAMHEAEKALNTDELFEQYYLTLYETTRSTRWPVCATALQRAEAFLRTLDKWKD
jgi:hypothetical protein